MTSKSLFWITITVGAFFFVIAVIAAAGGHGSLYPLKMFFPYSMIVSKLSDKILLFFSPSLSRYNLNTVGSFIPFFLIVIQFPFYGVCLAVANSREKLVWVFPILIVIHIAFAYLALNVFVVR